MLNAERFNLGHPIETLKREKPETNSSHLNMDGQKIKYPFREGRHLN